MTYTSARPRLVPSSDELRARVPGWGADLDPSDRPSVPRLQSAPGRPRGHEEPPEQQPETWPRERSIEHLRLTPVFGTACPPKGLSGAIRRLAYARYSEARTAHWLLLMAGDRVDTVESALASFATMRPDNPITQTGVLSEVRAHGYRSRVGRGRADVKHQWIDPLLVGAPWMVAAGAAYGVARAVTRPIRHR